MNRARGLFHQGSVALFNRLAQTPRTARAVFAMLAFHDHWQEHLSDEARFLAFCGSMRPLAHGQILQDLWVLFETDLCFGGYFVEFGAFDGDQHSNTKLLEERFGWKGILAEPNPDLVPALRQTRTAVVDSRCVWSSSGDTVELLLSAYPVLSTIATHAAPDRHTEARHVTAVRTVPVTTVSLNDLLDKHGAPPTIDFMSIDTEGTELRILQAFDFAPHRPRLIAVEHNHRPDLDLIDSLMADAGYERRFASMSDWDAWYRLRDRA